MHESQHHACATRTRVPAQSPHVGDQLLRVTMTFVDASSIRELLRSSARLCVLTAASIPNAPRVECARNRNLHAIGRRTGPHHEHVQVHNAVVQPEALWPLT